MILTVRHMRKIKQDVVVEIEINEIQKRDVISNPMIRRHTMSRDLEYLAWSNELAPLEKQSGSKWNSLIRSENAHFSKALKDYRPKTVSKSLVNSSAVPWTYRGWIIDGELYSPVQIWIYSDTFRITAWDADIDSGTGLFAGAVQDKDGYERFSVEVYSVASGTPKHVETLKKTGPQVAWLDKHLIYLGSSNDLWYNSVYCWDPISSRSKELYHLEKKEENLELGRAEDGSVYVIASDFEMKRLGFLTVNGIDWVAKGKDCVVVTRDHYYVDIKDSSEGVLESLSFKAGWRITRSYGIRTLWLDTRAVLTIWGEIGADTRDPWNLYVADVRYNSYWIRLPEWISAQVTPIPYPFDCAYYRHPFPAFVVRSSYRKTPKGLLIIAYSAYGFPTRIGSLVHQWKDLLEDGWAIASINLPGSGDHDVQWKESGQRHLRQNALTALKESIEDLQEELGVGPDRTCLYGRSAGGLIVISTAIQNPELVGALYVESPYVDVLRTISNPLLPLTLMETKEFGIGTNPVDVLSTGLWSPMEHIPEEGIVGLFVIARTDLNDLEVYPYEVLKWILRMRSNEKDEQPKLLKIHEGKGHFTTTSESRSEDLFLLKRWIKNIGGKYNQMNAPTPNAEKMMAGGKRNRMNRTQRKNRMNRVNRMNRMNRTERKNRMNRSNRNRSNRNRSNRNRVNRH